MASPAESCSACPGAAEPAASHRATERTPALRRTASSYRAASQSCLFSPLRVSSSRRILPVYISHRKVPIRRIGSLPTAQGAHMVRKLGFFATFLMLSLVASPALAQVQSGSIFVKVVDEQGAALPGVTLTLTSNVLPRPVVAVTDSEGAHRFSALTLGTYSVKTTLAGFQT